MNTIYGEWTRCEDCIYFDDCDTKENRDGCLFGKSDNINEGLRRMKEDRINE